MKTIAVGSLNPVKLAAVKTAIKDKLIRVKVVAVDVDSGVDGQPRSDAATRLGALNRAHAALKAVKSDLAIGLEGGIIINRRAVWNTVWCCAVDKQDRISLVNGERFILPQKISTPIRQGIEMGPLMDELTGRKNIKHQEGMLGIVTGGWVSRETAYAHLVRLVLGRLFNPDWLD
ncbi:hypothetical protein A3A66_03155 [Microgenomates group bacterium RIFCSPLOWO2_01_FULL_46_13]|nr:MAG: hypothetical protein A2783_04850 [Microgenomates group bacterium RIFCSPHIGHO2_01_FULL_45_11]OGV94167.1 MAG: hypothetical protein A3A66_03155 [Microgenomates group bacterium RIFCSPLOWO2_01_FULL_46_13]